MATKSLLSHGIGTDDIRGEHLNVAIATEAAYTFVSSLSDQEQLLKLTGRYSPSLRNLEMCWTAGLHR